MTMILNRHRDLVRMFHHTKNKVSMTTHSKSAARKGRHAKRPTHKFGQLDTDTTSTKLVFLSHCLVPSIDKKFCELGVAWTHSPQKTG